MLLQKIFQEVDSNEKMISNRRLIYTFLYGCIDENKNVFAHSREG